MLLLLKALKKRLFGTDYPITAVRYRTDLPQRRTKMLVQPHRRTDGFVVHLRVDRIGGRSLPTAEGGRSPERNLG
jgi:hypothetical protein